MSTLTNRKANSSRVDDSSYLYSSLSGEEEKVVAIIKEELKKFSPEGTVQVDEYRHSYEEVSTRYRKFLARMIARFPPKETIIENPQRLFHIHRHFMALLGGSMGYYISVMYNLFLGTVFSLGTDKHWDMIKDDVLNNGEIGCFAMTELEAGIYSGSVIRTEAVYDEKTDSYSLTSTDPKRWISLGDQAKYSVVIANLIFKGENKGPHIFLVDFSQFTNDRTPDAWKTGKLPPNTVNRYRMLNKTLLVGLDNAVIFFNQCKIPGSALLNRYVNVSSEGEYTADGGRFSFMRVISRLIAGRLCIATAAHGTLGAMYDDTLRYVSTKQVNLYYDKKKQGTVTDVMYALPQIRNALDDLKRDSQRFEPFLAKTHAMYCKQMDDPSPQLMERIYIAKSFYVYSLIHHTTRIKEVIGTHALFQDSLVGRCMDVPFSLMVVEGDNNLLQQQIVKNLVTRCQQNPLSLMYKLITSERVYAWPLSKLVMRLATSRDQYRAFIDENCAVREVAELYSEYCIMADCQ